MAWKFDNPLGTLTTDDQNASAKKLWNEETLGNITEDNKRLPQPIVGLMVLTIITAFMITFPLWGKRPTAAIYAPYIEMMSSAEVQGKSDDEAMAYIVSQVKASGFEWQSELERHPLEMDDLRLIRDQLIELKQQGVDLREYNVLGNKLVLANFEGNKRADGSIERYQPWWDKGYTIAGFFIIFFTIGVVIAIKRLPGNHWQPTHGGH